MLGLGGFSVCQMMLILGPHTVSCILAGEDRHISGKDEDSNMKFKLHIIITDEVDALEKRTMTVERE